MMDYRLAELTSEAELRTCASLMVNSNPWSALYFTQKQCEEDLANPAMVIHGAVDKNGRIVGFLASLKHGIGFEPMIEYLCVDQQFRNQGIGQRLISFFEE